MSRPGGFRAAHSRYCAARNKKTATVFLCISALEVAWHWGAISRALPRPPASMYVFVGLIAALVLMFDLMLSLRCFRERLVLGLGAASFLIALIEQMSPDLAASVLARAGQLILLLWVVAAFTSASLLLSATGWRRYS